MWTVRVAPSPTPFETDGFSQRAQLRPQGPSRIPIRELQISRGDDIERQPVLMVTHQRGRVRDVLAGRKQRLLLLGRPEGLHDLQVDPLFCGKLNKPSRQRAQTRLEGLNTG